MYMQLQVLLITLKLAIPSVLRFAVCMLILFMAFTFYGWLIIGPYNPQVVICMCCDCLTHHVNMYI